MPTSVANTAVLVAAFTPLVVGVLYVLWQVFLRKLPFHQYGIYQVIEALKWEPAAQQQSISRQGALTRFQWFQLRRRHQIRLETELRIR